MQNRQQNKPPVSVCDFAFRHVLFARVRRTKVTLQAGEERICAAGGLPSGTCRRLMTRRLPASSSHLNHTLEADLELISATRTPSLELKQIKKRVIYHIACVPTATSLAVLKGRPHTRSAFLPKLNIISLMNKTRQRGC